MRKKMLFCLVLAMTVTIPTGAMTVKGVENTEEVHFESDEDIEEMPEYTEDELLSTEGNVPEGEGDEEIEVGGIYTYVAENGFYTVTHRIVAEKDKNGEKYYIFKGDNNDEQDPKPIHRKRVKFKIKVKWVYIRTPILRWYRGSI